MPENRSPGISACRLACSTVLTATLLALGSAFVHASWNLIIKTSKDRAIAAWGVFIAAGLIAIPLLAVVGLPGWDTVPWIALTALVHIVYIQALSSAYTHGDFGATYPVARGGGALLAALGGALLLGDALPWPAWIALMVVAAGLIGMRSSKSTAGLGWALLTAACIGTYSVIDGHGSRLATSGASYGLALAPATLVTVSIAGMIRGQHLELARAWPTERWRWMAGGAGTLGAYTMVMIAVRLAPVGYVTMLRESSVVLGALAGWLILKEGLAARRLVAAAVILTGLVLLVVTTG